MRIFASLSALAAPAVAAAHDMGGPHHHPHVDPAILIGAILAVGVLAGLAWARSR